MIFMKEAIRLADMLERGFGHLTIQHYHQAANELRRLSAVEESRNAVQAEMADYVDMNRDPMGEPLLLYGSVEAANAARDMATENYQLRSLTAQLARERDAAMEVVAMNARAAAHYARTACCSDAVAKTCGPATCPHHTSAVPPDEANMGPIERAWLQELRERRAKK